MRVLHFYKQAIPDSMGGVEQVIHQLARGSADAGITADVLSLTAGPAPQSFEIDGYMGHRAKLSFEIASTGFSLSAFSMFASLAKKADIVHLHYPWPFMDLVHFAANLRKPTVVTYHSDIIRQKNLLKIYAPLQNCFLTSVDSIVATSQNYFATSRVLTRFKHKVDVIPIGLDESSYPQAKSDRIEHWRARFGTQFFLFVGVFRYYKGLHILLEAAQGLVCPVVILGTGPVESDLRAQAQRLGLSNIHFLGPLCDEDKTALLTLCLAVVFPSHLRSEAFGISLLEGAMFGKPMISSEIGTGTSFINITRETGLVVPPGDVGALQQAMLYLLNSPTAAAEMGQRAQMRFRSLFTAERMVQSYKNLYGKLLKR
jgi:rhamnosyl/mannosyltransferase